MNRLHTVQDRKAEIAAARTQAEALRNAEVANHLDRLADIAIGGWTIDLTIRPGSPTRPWYRLIGLVGPDGEGVKTPEAFHDDLADLVKSVARLTLTDLIPVAGKGVPDNDSPVDDDPLALTCGKMD